jgi:2Fe-2S ferredoxin
MAYQVCLIDSFGELKTLSFRTHQYENFMQMIVDQLSEDIGDCMGRAWCGTCHVELVKGNLVTGHDSTERHKLKELYNHTESSRLACQIMVTHELNELTFKLLSEDA